MKGAVAQFDRVRRESGWGWAAAVAADRLGLPLLQRLWSPCLVTADQLRVQLEKILLAWGMSEQNADLCAQRIVYADLRAIDSHGAAMMPFYRQRLAAGRLCMNPEIAVVSDGPATALVDGGGGLGHLAGSFAIELAVQKARASGLAAVGVRNSFHFGAAGAYAAVAAEEGMIALVTTATPTPSVVPTFARDAELGTNPIAFFAPGRNGSTFALDMATSTASRGKVLDRWRRGDVLPGGWATDRRGRPLRNGRRAFDRRRLAPLGGSPEGASHKGYGLAVMVEILSSVLTGARDPSSRESAVGHFFTVLDPGRFREDGQFGHGVDSLLADLRSSETDARGSNVLVAGDPEEVARRERSRTGIPLSRHVFEDLRHLSSESGAEFLLERA